MRQVNSNGADMKVLVGQQNSALTATADHPHHSITRNGKHKPRYQEPQSGGGKYIGRTTWSSATPATTDATGKSTLYKAPIHVVGSKRKLWSPQRPTTAETEVLIPLRREMKTRPQHKRNVHSPATIKQNLHPPQQSARNKQSGAETHPQR